MIDRFRFGKMVLYRVTAYGFGGEETVETIGTIITDKGKSVDVVITSKPPLDIYSIWLVFEEPRYSSKWLKKRQLSDKLTPYWSKRVIKAIKQHKETK